MLMYLIKANVVLVVLFGFYQLISGGDTFFKWRRLSLLSIYVLSLLLPTINLASVIDDGSPVANILPRIAYFLPEVTVQPMPEAFDWHQFMIWMYVAVALALLLRVCWQVVMVCRLALRSKRLMLHGTAVYVLAGDYSPFSFFRWIFVSPVDKTPLQLRQILTHEQTHVAQWHSVDALLSQLFVAAFWFNPIAWLMRVQVRSNLEYLADRSVLCEGMDKKAYQYHLLAVAYRTNVATITNNFNVLPLKKRIKMMNKQTSNPLARLKYLLFVPLTIALMAMNSSVIRANVQKKEVREAQTVKKAAPDNKVYEACEQMPSYVGGQPALMKYLIENVRYPKAAVETKQQGRVVVQFVVEKDGAVSSVKLLKSVTPLLDAEAIRVVKAMPKWNPGKKDGKLVRVRYALPVSFRLS